MLQLRRKNILVVTDTFSFGGLETQIHGTFKVLKKLGYRIYFVVGRTYIEKNLPYTYCEEIYLDLNFSLEASAKEILDNKNFLSALVRKHSIDVIHCHPFISFIPAFITAQENKLPFIYSLHGPVSLNSSFSQLYDFLLKSVMLPSASMVHCVSKEMQILAKNFAPNTYIAPNGVDVDEFAATSQAKKSKQLTKCCHISRIDSSKIVSIKFFIEQAASQGIKEIDIIGDGPEKQALIDWLNEIENKDLKVTIVGYKNNISELLLQYDMAVGMERVVLEAASCNIPIVLSGYDGLKGLMDENQLTHAAAWNNSGRGLPNVNEIQFREQMEDLKKDPEKYELRNWILSNANESTIWTEFSTQLQLIEFHQAEFVTDLTDNLQLAVQQPAPALLNYDFLQSIREVLRGGKYILSQYYRYMVDYDNRVHNYTFANNTNDHFKTLHTLVHASADRNAVDLKTGLTSFEQAFVNNTNSHFSGLKTLIESNANKYEWNLTSALSHIEQLIIKSEEASRNGFERYNKLEELLNKKEQEILNFRAEKESLTSCIENLQINLNNLQNQLELMQRSRDTLAESLGNREATLKIVEEKNQRVTERCKDQEELAKQQEARIQVLSKQVKDLSEQVKWFEDVYENSSVWKVLKRKLRKADGDIRN